jgi:putative oxidoreductase
MQNALNNLLTVVGRLAIVAVFAGAAVQKLTGFGNVVKYMEAHYVPQPKIALVGAIVLLIAGSASILLGYRAKLGAVMLFVFLAAATYYFHPFWKNPSEQINFMKNLSIAGALLFIMANGSGPASLKRD